MADDEKLYRHIHIRGLGKAPSNFRAPGGGKDRPIDPVGDRVAHARRLRRELDIATEKFGDYVDEQADIGLPPRHRGMPLTMVGRPNVGLRVGQGRPSSTNGLKILNVRRAEEATSEEDSNSGTDQATFFVTRSRLDGLRKNLDEYETVGTPTPQQSKKVDRPPNFGLFESGSMIRETSLRDLWTDDVDAFPTSRASARWEVWTQTQLQPYFLKAAKILGLEFFGKPTEFVETVVHGIVATPIELQRLVRQSAAVVELRSASSFASGFFSMDAEDRAIAINAVLRRIERAPTTAPKVTILDTGVNRNNPLLKGSLPASDCRTVETSWGSDDHSGHGTKMAGLALYGDLEEAIVKPGPIILEANLESIVVTSPTQPATVPARDALQRAVDIVERKPARRVFCLAQTAVGESETGRPTSTSAVLDKLAFNDGKATRLFCAAVGNVPHSRQRPYPYAYYENRNERFGIQSPAQAVNALAVGAVSLKPGDRNRNAVAPIGDLMPLSRTATPWPGDHAGKPDIVMEGGNLLVDEDNMFCRPSPAHLVLTTSRDLPDNPLDVAGQTSTATALAAGLAARLAARYPKYRMETIRGMMVHAARWTPAMIEQAQAIEAESGEPGWSTIIDRFGWGVPSVERLFNSASNALTLVFEDDLQPYERKLKDGKEKEIRLREMKYFKLPWPKETLQELKNTEVRMRCTLSYFVDPDPHAVSRDRTDRYHSHRLKFDVKRYGEDDARAQRRSNRLADESETEAGTNEGWLSAQRPLGTILQDEWTGKAYQLAERDGISVLPVRGWWGDMMSTHNWKRSVRFSLIVSVETPETAGKDFVAEVAKLVSPALLVDKIQVLV
ncbi:S8 family peptidase [Bradyrhizobium liaoningense]|uniref:S8 family peptidase n=1 Tax=Bradyrhizobium liaoningense TaxID=43992 RepID=UPI001BA603B0|nr:S8 family peptidase [Bradyrhizobium liaoningense]MBR0736958.1 S8 family peptidase [Bradyrhizobium liaoningense]